MALLAIAAATVLLRGQLADELVVRGDRELYRGMPTLAWTYYERAAWFDPTDAAAIDRIAFLGFASHRLDMESKAVAVSSGFLALRPQTDTVRFDRAMLFHRLADRRRALADFAILSRHGDARAAAFAGYEADRLGRAHDARVFWRRALSALPDLPSARHGLARLEPRP